MTKQLPLSMFLTKDTAKPNKTLEDAVEGWKLEDLSNIKLVFIRDHVRLNDPDRKLVQDELDLRLASHGGGN